MICTIVYNNDRSGIINSLCLVTLFIISTDDQRYFKTLIYCFKFKVLQEIYKNKLYKNKLTLIILCLWVGLFLVKSPSIDEVVFVSYFCAISDCFQCGWGKASPDTIKKYPFSCSPNKSINGYIGALISLFVFAPTLVSSVGNGNAIIYFIVGCLGDLTGSYIKRNHGIKDYGSCLGPMGGVLDRIDSHVMVLNFIAIQTVLLGYFSF